MTGNFIWIGRREEGFLQLPALMEGAKMVSHRRDRDERTCPQSHWWKELAEGTQGEFVRFLGGRNGPEARQWIPGIHWR